MGKKKKNQDSSFSMCPQRQTKGNDGSISRKSPPASLPWKAVTLSWTVAYGLVTGVGTSLPVVASGVHTAVSMTTTLTLGAASFIYHRICGKAKQQGMTIEEFERQDWEIVEGDSHEDRDVQPLKEPSKDHNEQEDTGAAAPPVDSQGPQEESAMSLDKKLQELSKTLKEQDDAAAIAQTLSESISTIRVEISEGYEKLAAIGWFGGGQKRHALKELLEKKKQELESIRNRDSIDLCGKDLQDLQAELEKCHEEFKREQENILGS
jgi:hypothetical protein